MEPIAVTVRVNVDTSGVVTPQRITMPDGQSYAIDKVLDARPVQSRKAGGEGMRYRVKVKGQTVTLVQDGVWTLEWDD